MFDLDDPPVGTDVPPEADLIPPLTRIARALELLLFWVRLAAFTTCTIAVCVVLRSVPL